MRKGCDPSSSRMPARGKALVRLCAAGSHDRKGGDFGGCKDGFRNHPFEQYGSLLTGKASILASKAREKRRLWKSVAAQGAASGELRRGNEIAQVSYGSPYLKIQA